ERGPDHLLQDSDGRGQGPAIGQAFLYLFEGQRVAVVHQFLVEVAVDLLEPCVERIVRIVVLVAFDSPVTHGPPQALLRPSRPGWWSLAPPVRPGDRMSPGPPAGSSWRWIRCRRPEPEKSHGDRFGQASDDAIHVQEASRGGSGRANRSRTWSRRGGATKVGVVIGVRRTISAGSSRSPPSVPKTQPASLEMTTPAAMSCVASPRNVQA